jgi:hypothetical protein
LDEAAVVKSYLITASDGKNYQTKHYSLQAIIAVGFKIENERAVQFRKWANQIVKDYTIQGWTMDAERLKHGGTLTDEFFERQLEKIREIRLSERKFYQKITDIYATALDYDPSATATKRFFAAVQNKMHYAVHGQTAAEVIVDRADHQKQNMGLTTWENAPKGMGDDKLKLIAAELISQVKRSVIIDWTLRESARARIKVMVKRILNKHGYPPDLQEEAVKTVLAQAELLCAEWV